MDESPPLSFPTISYPCRPVGADPQLFAPSKYHGWKKYCHAILPGQLNQEFADTPSGFFIHSRKRLVQNHNLRLYHQGPGDKNALLLTAGKGKKISPPSAASQPGLELLQSVFFFSGKKLIGANSPIGLISTTSPVLNGNCGSSAALWGT